MGVSGLWPFVHAGSTLGLFCVERLVKAEASCLVVSFVFSSFIPVLEKRWWPITHGLRTTDSPFSSLLFTFSSFLHIQRVLGSGMERKFVLF